MSSSPSSSSSSTSSSYSSYCWQAPIYITVSIVLAFFAISTALHSSSSSDDTMPLNNLISHQFSFNASKALRNSGFNTIATLVEISPEFFFSTTNATIFAINDSTISNSSNHPWLLKDILKYHISPLTISMDDLVKKPKGSCFPTLLQRKNIVLTKVDDKDRVVDINDVRISHPNLFLEGSVSIHGVLGTFSVLKSQNGTENWDFKHVPQCDLNVSVLTIRESMEVIDWMRIIRLLSSNGFISFAIGLHSVLDGILQDFTDVGAVTIFTPPDFTFVASAGSPNLHKIVRFHILPKKLTYIELASLPDKTLLRTMNSDQDLEISGTGNITQGLTINGVDITAPDFFSSKKFIIHGVSRDFEMTDLPTKSR